MINLIPNQEKKKIEETNDKLREVNDYLHKFTLEKRLYLDKVDEQMIIDLSKFKILINYSIW